MTEGLKIPLSVYGQQNISPGIDDVFFFERYLGEGPAIQQILKRSGFVGLQNVADFGCHIGGWSWQLAILCKNVFALDVSEKFMPYGQLFAKDNGLSNITFIKIDSETLKGLPLLDGIICLETLTFMNSTQIHEFFHFARTKLKIGGLLLLRVPNVKLLLEMLIKLERLKSDTWKAQIGWLMRFLRALTIRKMDRPGGRWVYYALPQRIILSLAKEYGFHVIFLPRQFNAFPETREYNLERFRDKNNWFEHYDWYLLQKPDTGMVA